jgi:adenine phosphoribosyltransferase
MAESAVDGGDSAAAPAVYSKGPPVAAKGGSVAVLDPERARRHVAAALRVVPFRGLEKFYDIAPLLRQPFVFNLTMALWARTWADRGIDCVAGVDARGFLLGMPLALRLGLPFEMVRKAGKLPGATATGPEYVKEYAEAHGADALCAQTDGALQPGARVLLVDDLVATGGTMVAAVQLLHKMGAVVVACACLVEIEGLGAQAKVGAGVPIVPLLLPADLARVPGPAPSKAVRTDM